MRRPTALIVVASLLVACTGGAGSSPDGSSAGGDGPGSSDAPAGDPAGRIADAASGLPDDPRAAARTLVRAIFTAPDDAAAVGPLGELFRRSGLPVVTADGSIVALPDDAGFERAPVYLELLEGVAHSVRARSAIPYPAFASGLTQLGITTEDAPWEAFALLLGSWGKSPDTPDFAATASSAVRALAAERGETIDPYGSDDAQWIDPVQSLLLVTHLGGEAAERMEMPSSLRMPASAAGLCADLDKAFNKQEGLNKMVVDYLKKVLGGVEEYTTGFLEEAEAQGKLTGLDGKMFGGYKKVKGAVGGIGDISGYVGLALLLNGLRMTVVGKTATHYKHSDGDTGPHVTVTAQVTFESGLDKGLVECFNLAGGNLPPDGDQPGMTVQWGLDQPLRAVGPGPASGAHLLPVQRQPDPIGKNLQGTTNDAGKVRWELKPPVEDKPNQGEEQVGTATITAQLVKDEADWEIGDFVKALSGNVIGAITDPLVRKATEITVNAALPSARHVVNVTFHGAEPLIVKGGVGSIFGFGVTLNSLDVDLVSCSGRTGPFIGTASWGGATKNIVTEILGDPIANALGYSIPDNVPGSTHPVAMGPGTIDKPTIMEMIPGDGGWLVNGSLVLFPPTDDWRRVTALYDEAKRIGSEVGEFEFILRDGFNLMGLELTLPVYAVKNDPRCPDRYFHWDGL